MEEIKQQMEITRTEVEEVLNVAFRMYDELFNRYKLLKKENSKLKKDSLDLEKRYIEKCEDCEELDYKIETLKEEIKRIYEDRNENYRHIEYSSQI